MKTQDGELENFPMNTRVKLAGLWIVLMLLYIYCDIYSLHRPGYISEMIAGFIGPFEVSQMTLALFGILMAIPALMILVCLFIRRAAIAKWINVVAGVVYTIVNVGNLVGESWAYYWLYGVIEIAVTVGAVVLAVKWPKEAIVNEQ